MDITIYGAGYVGLVSAVCFAEIGHNVLCVEISESRLQVLKAGECPIYEPGLTELLRKNIAQGRLAFTGDTAQGVAHGDFQFIAVGTPSNAEGAADLSYVFECAKNIARHLENQPRIIITKSTVPVGTNLQVQQVIANELEARDVKVAFDVCSNPEFLKEGAAIKDFMEPDRVIIGAEKSEVADQVAALYSPLLHKAPAKIQKFNLASAELIKYAANAMLATKISFINEISRIAEAVGADIDAVKDGIGSDQRIGPHFLNAGCGYGGSCFPKDVKALIHTAHAAELEVNLLEAVESVNYAQKRKLATKVENAVANGLRNKAIAVWGLAFKPGTDDVREASSAVLIEDLLTQGANIQAYDPVAQESFKRTYPALAINYADTELNVLEGVDTLVVCTEWYQFKQVPLAKLAELGIKNIIDGRNIYDPLQAKELGINYQGIGR